MKSSNTPYLSNTISLRLSSEERAALENRAARESRTLSNLMRKFVREQLLREDAS
jgi:hypothetical protein